MKKSTLQSILCCCFLFFLTTITNAQTYQWAQMGTSIGFNYGNGILADDSGNVYVSGQFEYDCNFGSVTLHSRGQHDIFLVKYSPTGILRWAKSAGSWKGGDAGYGLGIDAQRNVYMTGEFEDTCFWTATDSLWTGNGTFNNIFISKYNNNGVFQWVRKATGNGDGRGKALVSDKNGYSYLTGSYSSSVTFGGNPTLTNTGNTDVFLAKYDANGNAAWSKKVGSTGDDKGKAVAIDTARHLIYLAGTFSRNTTVGSFPINVIGPYDSFIAKYDTTGTPLWAKTMGGTDTTKIQGMTTDEAGNIYVTGYFQGTTTIGSTILTSTGSYEFFMAKYDINGNFIWAKQGGGIYEDFGQGIFYDRKTKNICLTGQFDCCATFGSFSVNSVLNRDVFIAGCDTAGTFLWIRTGGGTGRDAGFAICADTLTNMFATGFFNDTAVFGGTTLNGDTLPNVFVTKLSPPVGTEPTVAASGLTASIVNCNDIQLTWTRGNGNRCIVIAKANTIVNGFPVDGVGYTASNTFGSGNQIGTGNYVVYDGTGTTVTVTGLTTGVTYYFIVVEYSGTGGSSNYALSGYPTANAVANSFVITTTSSDSAYCPGGSTVLSASGALTYTWSPSTGLSATTGSTVTANPTSTITYTIDGADGSNCHAITTTTVTVYALPTVTFGVVSAVCEDGAAVTLTEGSPLGGDYSGIGVFGNTFDPIIAGGAGTYTLTYSYTDANTCTDSATSSITVNALPTVTLSSLSDVCVNTSSFIITGGSPAGGTYSGTGVSAGSFSASTAGVGSHAITYTYTDGNTCENSATSSITVNDLPVVTLGSFASVCINAATFTLTGGSPAGGTYTGTGVTAGSFHPSTAGAGTFTITYSYTDGNTCVNTATSTITVNALPVVTLSSFSPVCANDVPVTLTGGSPAGGTYAGSGVSTGLFYPAVVGAGTYVIIYNYTDGNTCSSSATSSITVNAVPTVTMSSLNPVCADAAAFTLTVGSPTGGTYSGTGVVFDMFDANVAGAGTFTVNYSYTDSNTCSNSASTSITVNALPLVNLGLDTITCANASITLNAGSGFSSYAWTGGQTTSSITIDSTGIGIGTAAISVMVTDTNGCSNTDDVMVTFSPCNAVNEISLIDLVQLFPNPTSGKTTLSFFSNESAKFELLIHNLTGKVIMQDAFLATHGMNRHDIDMSKLAKGVYLIRLLNKDVNEVVRVTLE